MINTLFIDCLHCPASRWCRLIMLYGSVHKLSMQSMEKLHGLAKRIVFGGTTLNGCGQLAVEQLMRHFNRLLHGQLHGGAEELTPRPYSHATRVPNTYEGWMNRQGPFRQLASSVLAANGP